MKALDSVISLELFLFHTSGFPYKDKTYKDNKASIRTNHGFGYSCRPTIPKLPLERQIDEKPSFPN